VGIIFFKYWNLWSLFNFVITIYLNEQIIPAICYPKYFTITKNSETNISYDSKEKLISCMSTTTRNRELEDSNNVLSDLFWRTERWCVNTKGELSWTIRYWITYFLALGKNLWLISFATSKKRNKGLKCFRLHLLGKSCFSTFFIGFLFRLFTTNYWFKLSHTNWLRLSS
jgi:hypothetical protein